MKRNRECRERTVSFVMVIPSGLHRLLAFNYKLTTLIRKLASSRLASRIFPSTNDAQQQPTSDDIITVDAAQARRIRETASFIATLLAELAN